MRPVQRKISRDTPNPVRIRLLDEPTFTRPGRMDFVDNRLDATTGTMRGRALVPNPDGFLTPGQFGRVQLLGSGEFDALLIPDSAILTDQSRRFVWTVDENNMPEQRVIEPGGLERGLRIVRAGLQPGDRDHHQRHAARAPRGTRRADGWACRAACRQLAGATVAFSKLFIDRPILAGVISVLVMLVGAVAYLRLPVSQYPRSLHRRLP